ncbi:MAG TPA: YibE/F family protein [Jatrophihabitans sp.]|nr:YibE/F family protein [Jatrophihabitans sp.]
MAPSHRPAVSANRDVLAQRWIVGVLALLGIVVAIALALSWPAHPDPAGNRLHGEVVGATVQSVAQGECGSDGSCVSNVVALLTSGPDRHQVTMLTLSPGPTSPRLTAGDHIRLARTVQSGQTLYEFDDIDRGRPLLALCLAFLLLALLVGRWRGVAAIAGLAFTGLLLVTYVVPALVDGHSPLLVALLAGSAITLVVLPLAHGLSSATGVAMVGTLVGMSVAAVLAAALVGSLRITGLSSEEFATLSLQGSHSTVSGLFLAGAVIGALGVLNDVTVTQASAVAELSGGAAGRREAFASAMRIGRDHIASTVYSLVLAYAGSALPLLLLFSLSGQSTMDSLTSDALAPEIASSLIGSIALVLVVPLTTAGAAAIHRPRRSGRPVTALAEVRPER